MDDFQIPFLLILSKSKEQNTFHPGTYFSVGIKNHLALGDLQTKENKEKYFKFTYSSAVKSTIVVKNKLAL